LKLFNEADRAQPSLPPSFQLAPPSALCYRRREDFHRRSLSCRDRGDDRSSYCQRDRRLHVRTDFSRSSLVERSSPLTSSIFPLPSVLQCSDRISHRWHREGLQGLQDDRILRQDSSQLFVLSLPSVRESEGGGVEADLLALLLVFLKGLSLRDSTPNSTPSTTSEARRLVSLGSEGQPTLSSTLEMLNRAHADRLFLRRGSPGAVVRRFVPPFPLHLVVRVGADSLLHISR